MSYCNQHFCGRFYVGVQVQFCCEECRKKYLTPLVSELLKQELKRKGKRH